MPQATVCRWCPHPLTSVIERAYGAHVDCDPPPRKQADASTAPPPQPAVSAVFDWPGKDGAPKARAGGLKPCVVCGSSTLLRHPETDLPHHKTCAEKALTEAALRNGRRPLKGDQP